eukprot:8318654-Karenia_brevis.AAC.1
MAGFGISGLPSKGTATTLAATFSIFPATSAADNSNQSDSTSESSVSTACVGQNQAMHVHVASHLRGRCSMCHILWIFAQGGPN